jgi:uncharacterized protein (DUF924 family)
VDAAAKGILDFWLDEVGPEGWWAAEELDPVIRERFRDLWEDARTGGRDGWTCGPRSCLALVILLDQFPRNMFRGDRLAFASDAKSVAVAKGAIARGLDGAIEPAARSFFYMPLQHSEMLADQDKAVRLVVLNYGPGDLLNHFRAHRLVIRRFGRFPYRNAALGRRTTPEEQAFLDAGGYPAALAEVAQRSPET